MSDVLTNLRSAEGPQLQSMLQTLNTLLIIYDNLQTVRQPGWAGWGTGGGG